jgi:hypothetical protein
VLVGGRCEADTDEPRSLDHDALVDGVNHV